MKLAPIVLRVLSGSLLLLVSLRIAVAGPSIFWTSDPVDPGETVLFTGADLDEVAKIQLFKLTDNADGLSLEQPIWRAEIAQRSSNSIKAKIPVQLATGVYEYALTTEGGETLRGLINCPIVYWRQGNLGTDASPGGWIRILGRNISRTISVMTLRSESAPPIKIVSRVADTWDARFELPDDLPLGSYSVAIWNGQGDSRSVVDVGQLTVRPAWKVPDHQVDIRQFGARGNGKDDDTSSVVSSLRLLERLGGGVLRIPRGTYLLTGQLTIPRNVIVRGDSETLSVLLLKDTENPPSPLIEGLSDFRLENFSIVTTRHGHIIAGGFSSNGQIVDTANIGIDRVTIRASMFRGHLKMEKAASILASAMATSPPRGPDMIRLAGGNLSVTNSDIYGSVNPLYLQSPRNSVVQGNRIAIGRYGWYSITNPNGLIMQDNDIYGVDQEGGGGGINTLFGPGRASAQNVLVKNNRFSLLMGQDGEGLTSDGPGGCYYGGVSVEKGTNTARLTNISEDLSGCRKAGGLVVLDGYGVGAYSGIESVEGDIVRLTEPFPVTTNDTSVAVIVPMHRRYLVIGNQFRDAGVAVQFYGSSWDQVAANNRSLRTGGIVVDGRSYGKYFQPALNAQLLGNTIEAGTVGGLTGFAPADATLKAVASPVAPNTAALVRGVVMRKNILMGNASIDVQGKDSITPSVVDVVVEGNSVQNVDVAVRVDRGAARVLIDGNNYDGVKVPVIDRQVH